MYGTAVGILDHFNLTKHNPPRHRRGHLPVQGRRPPGGVRGHSPGHSPVRHAHTRGAPVPRRQQAAEERPVPVRVRRNPPRHRVTRPLRAQARTRQTPQRRGHVPRPQEMQRTILHAQERHPLRTQGPTTGRPPHAPRAQPPRATTRNREKATRSPRDPARENDTPNHQTGLTIT